MTRAIACGDRRCAEWLQQKCVHRGVKSPRSRPIREQSLWEVSRSGRRAGVGVDASEDADKLCLD